MYSSEKGGSAPKGGRHSTMSVSKSRFLARGVAVDARSRLLGPPHYKLICFIYMCIS